MPYKSQHSHQGQIVPGAAGRDCVRDVNSSTSHREDIVWLTDNKISEGGVDTAERHYEFRGMAIVKR